LFSFPSPYVIYVPDAVMIPLSLIARLHSMT
jgi:hypothetical protein